MDVASKCIFALFPRLPVDVLVQFSLFTSPLLSPGRPFSFHQWLLAMLCYRFALRISHHTRQPWCRGARATGFQSTPADVDPLPGPEVVRQLQRRQRQLLENSLELLEVRVIPTPSGRFIATKRSKGYNWLHYGFFKSVLPYLSQIRFRTVATLGGFLSNQSVSLQ